MNENDIIHIPHAEDPSSIPSPLVGEGGKQSREDAEEAGEVAVPREWVHDMRLKLAHVAASYFAELSADVSLEEEIPVFLEETPLFPPFQIGRTRQILASFQNPNPAHRNNVLFACLLFYVLNGEYPDELWREATMPLEEIPLFRVQERCKGLASLCEDEKFAKQAGEVKALSKGLRRHVESEAVISLSDGDGSVGATKLNELFWEVFVTKYANYKPSFWARKIGEFIGKEFQIREGCEYKRQHGNAEIYAVSYEGKLDKPLHDECEDYCLVRFYSDSIWLAASADGVGSCVNSSLGSSVACESLFRVIARHLKECRYHPCRRGSDGAAALMHALRFSLAEELSREWAKTLSARQEFAGDLSQFTCTLQFAFGCPDFIACGRVGDGSFYVRLCDRGDEGERYGGMLLNDGISGVTQVAVFSLAHLAKRPGALRVDFFRPDEVSDIVIASDGVSGFVGETVGEAENFLQAFRSLPFDERARYLSRIARLASDYNETGHGSGDDSTLIHIHLN